MNVRQSKKRLDKVWTVRLTQDLRDRMDEYEWVNWGLVCRTAIEETLMAIDSEKIKNPYQ